MAEKLTDFMTALEASEPPHFTAPQVRYGYEEDSLLFYFRQEESFAQRVNNVITLFLSFEGHEVVGCQIKGLRHKLLSDGILALQFGEKDNWNSDSFFICWLTRSLTQIKGSNWLNLVNGPKDWR
jgi:hypothetical protein